MSDYLNDLNRAKALGLEYANNGIAAGEQAPQDSPLSGEWADGITVRDIFVQLGADYDKAEDFERTDVADSWEDGYRSAAWPFTTQDVEVCLDCYHYHHSGEKTEGTNPLSQLEPGEFVTDNGDGESAHFSGWPCVMCESRLAGERFTLTLWSPLHAAN